MAVHRARRRVRPVPARGQSAGRNWTFAVADPRAGVELLRTTQAAGHGAVRAISHKDAPKLTVDQLLADEKVVAGNTEAADAIDRSLKLLMDETGVQRNEVIGVPALFSKDALGFDGMPPGNLRPGFPPPAGNAANTYAPDPDELPPRTTYLRHQTWALARL
jgi:protein-arginine deiminase